MQNVSFDSFLTCAGLGATGAPMSQEKVKKLMGLLDAGFDLYTYLRSGRQQQMMEMMMGMGMMMGNSSEESMGDDDASSMMGLRDPRFISKWFKIGLQSQLPFLSKGDLSCLKNANLTCASFQALVMSLSDHLGERRTNKKETLYREFIMPFLSRKSGCAQQTNGSKEWLMKNLRSFLDIVTLAELMKLNANFSALDALDKLTAEHLVDLVLRPSMDNTTMDNSTMDKSTIIIHVLQSLVRPLLMKKNSNMTGNMTMDMMPMGMHGNGTVLKGLLMKLKPLGMFIHKFVAALEQRNDTSLEVKELLTQKIVNWTLSELSGFFSQNFTLNNQTFMGQEPSAMTFNLTSVKDWFTHLVVPLLKQALPMNDTESLKDLTDAFKDLFPSPSNATMDPDMFRPADVCRPNHNNDGNSSDSTCLITKRAEDLDVVLRCVAKSKMNVTGEKIKALLSELLSTLRRHKMMDGQRPMMSMMSGPVPPVIFSREQLRDPELMAMWAAVRLVSALPMVPGGSNSSSSSCLINQHFNCEAFQAMVQSLGKHVMDKDVQKKIYMGFIKPFLKRNDTQDPGCVQRANNSREWLEKYLGKFAALETLKELKLLNMNFTAMDVLPLLTPVQLAELAQIPGQLKDPEVLKKILKHVKDGDLEIFLDEILPLLQGPNLTQAVSSVILEHVLDRANLSDPSINDTKVLEWLNKRLLHLLPNMKPDQIKPLFNIIKGRQCETLQHGLQVLSSIHPKLKEGAKEKIQENILESLKGPSPLRCYRNNSFFMFLNDTFLDFGLPNLTTILSLIPPGRQPEVINSFQPSELGALMSRPNSVDNDTQLCTIFSSFNRTPEFLETVTLPADVGRLVLPCVWPLALAADDEAEADRWFNIRLKPYLPFLNKQLLTSTTTLGASCQPFSKLVGFLGTNHSFNGSDFTKDEAFVTIKQYLASDTDPKCYNATDPKLNSTAWFVNYVGGFVPLMTSDDMETFGSDDKLQVFTVNPQNIQLFTTTGVPSATVSSFTQLIFLQDPNFNVIGLPPSLQCGVPGTAYGTLNENQSLSIMTTLNQTCSNVDQEVFSALAGNVQTVTADTISTLGQGVVGLNVAQINAAPPSVILNSLSTFSTVPTWSQGQLFSIVNILFKQNYQITSPANLVNLGSLVGGVPSTTFTTITPQVALQASQTPSFITNLQSARPIVQQTFIKQIIKVDAAPAQLLTNIPDAMATEIPKNLLFFQNTGDVTVIAKNINKKKWKPQQAMMFFDTAASGVEPEELSESVLSGFTCSRVRTITKVKVKKIVRACRRRKKRTKVVLKQKQLTCMYNLIKEDKPTDFVNYPSDMLLYYKYKDIPKANCKSYFTEVGYADFSVLRRALGGRRKILLNNARNCLGISGTNINSANLAILGNMACTLDRPYIQNSDPSVVEKMKDCSDYTEEQSNALQTVLIQGKTKYGPLSKWKVKTLRELGVMPLYFSHDFWKNFDKRTKKKFLKPFLKGLRKRKTQKRKLKRLFRQLMRGYRSKRSATCTEGTITKTIISDDSFPFGYDADQFKLCLSAQTVKDNLADLTEKVDVDEFQTVILEKLKEVYPSGLSDDQVQLLGSVSRVASLADIETWSISSPDTLAALMNTDDGEWDADKSKAIVTKFLKGVNNSIGASELNFLGGANLCALDLTTVEGIASDSIKEADTLDISNCSSAKKKALFTTAKKAFPISVTTRNTDTLTSYQLIQPYLGGADSTYIKSLTSSNVEMDIETFVDLDEATVLDLSVSDVSSLLGSNLPDLESYQNESVVQSWISRQLQTDLDTLGLGLTGGRVATTASANSTATTTTAATTATTTTTTTVAATATSAGNKETPYSLSFIILMLSLAFMRNPGA
ncbi:uncharacterized protein mslna [Engraulis encrasicolus]|uniref:uncharacterized protein mslna n=1 Tax=Engraulis encrasicolus TaxID=184585 RepID=UPI002FD1EB12